MPPENLIDPAAIDCTQIVADRAEIRKIMPHRFEMEMLSAIVTFDPVGQLIVAYKDIAADEFWVRGHFPGAPLLPGVLMLETAAQLMGSYIDLNEPGKYKFIALGGVENARFRSPVKIGDRLLLAAKPLKIHRRQMIFTVQGFVRGIMCFQCDVIGMPMALGSGE